MIDLYNEIEDADTSEFTSAKKVSQELFDYMGGEPIKGFGYKW